MKGFMRKKSENEHTHSASFYRPEFGIGDFVFIWGQVEKIQINEDGVWYTVQLERTGGDDLSVPPHGISGQSRFITIHGSEVFPAGLKTNDGEGIK